MRPLAENDIESELSYAYLHAVAAKAGMSCEVTGRHADNHGVDARLTAWYDDLPVKEVDLKIQLKDTTQQLKEAGGHLHYVVQGRNRYDALREERATPLILAVLLLPAEPDEWLVHSEQELILRRTVYWMSLQGAPPSPNSSGQTVYIPKAQVLDPPGLQALARRIGNKDLPRYQAP